MKNDLKNIKNKRFFIGMTAIFLVMISSFFCVLHANMDNYKNILIGDRAATMGSAFSAISDDAAGVFYNPAGLVYIPKTKYTGSANTYYQKQIIYEDAIESYNWERNSRTLKPNFFSMVNKHSSNFVWGLSYVVPYVSVEDQQSVYYDLENYSDYFFNYHDNDRTAFLGPSFSMVLSDSFSIGLSLYYFFRDRQIQSSQLLTITSDNDVTYIDQWQSSDQIISVTGFHPILGVMWSPLEKWSLGLSARAFSVIKADDSQNVINYNTAFSSDDLATDESDYSYSLSSSISDYETNYPVQFSGGISFFPSPYFLISSDIDYYHVSSDELSDVTNLSLGFELYLNESKAIRCGVFTNNSNVPDPTTNSFNRRSIDLFGVSLGYSIYGLSNSITLGMIYSSGNGLAQVYSGSSTIIDYNQSELTLLLSGSFY